MKQLLPRAFLLLCLTPFLLMGCGSVSTEVNIKAPIETVWKIISASETYPDWNPVLVKVQGQYAADAEMQNTVAMPPNGDIVDMQSRVVQLDAP